MNLDQLAWGRWSRSDAVSVEAKDPARALGSVICGLRVQRLAPGQQASQLHRHHFQEELFLITSGRGVLRHGDERFPVRAGDFVLYLAGDPEAHTFVNDGNEPLELVATGNRVPYEVCEYPEEGTVFVEALGGEVRADVLAGSRERVADWFAAGTVVQGDAELHRQLLLAIVETGRAPGLDALADAAGIGRAALPSAMQRLAEQHAVVLQPGSSEPWVVHPFSLSPTHVWVRTPRGAWWAPCCWCALGIAALTGGHADIRTRFGAEDDEVVLEVRDGRVSAPDVLVHFAIPPRDAWRNVIHYCATVLPFRSEPELQAWCDRHRIARGAAVPLAQVMDLARAWYGSHLDRDWHKWSVTEARTIFQRVGLVGPFWDLGDASGRF